MKRHGIFVFYEKEGNVKKYIIALLKSMKTILSELTIVVNGNIASSEFNKLKKYATRIFIRKNSGFDAGAYKDLFVSFMKIYCWDKFDEIILFNSTFYGPFVPWNKCFELMGNERCDFWGLTESLGCKGEFIAGIEENPHIQSYFIVIRKRMFLSNYFFLFWENMPYPNTHEEAVGYFELSFSKYFSEKNFFYKSLCLVKIKMLNSKLTIRDFNLEELITKIGLPVLKRKFVVLENYLYLKNIFRHLRMFTAYPVSLICGDTISNINEFNYAYNSKEILRFCSRFKSVYIYGHGKYAININEFLKDSKINVDGFIISEKGNDLKSICFDEFILPEDRGIIVSMNESNTLKIYKKVVNKIPNNLVYWPKYKSLKI